MHTLDVKTPDTNIASLERLTISFKCSLETANRAIVGRRKKKGGQFVNIYIYELSTFTFLFAGFIHKSLFVLHRRQFRKLNSQPQFVDRVTRLTEVTFPQRVYLNMIGRCLHFFY